ncbi:unnamed protein product [Bursaphelenchus xylophilus]|uniref:(pine wood nematode) hypothetical protein n=1 Tax=Bursaphelenchus xylophilus TaxID=6326 RepID=A0A1I7RZA8_BURXY|nr:unnamed protein product [Bursaphelenchus xylophilus]CAG9106668.1 unnamed protein product [Bursaphelenchus xylophilus]
MQISIQRAYKGPQSGEKPQIMAKCYSCGGSLKCPKPSCQHKRRKATPKKLTTNGLLEALVAMANRRLQDKPHKSAPSAPGQGTRLHSRVLQGTPTAAWHLSTRTHGRGRDHRPPFDKLTPEEIEKLLRHT